MTNTTQPVTIVITDFDGRELERIEIPARPPQPFAQRTRWRLRCWGIDLRNLVWRLKGGR